MDNFAALLDEEIRDKNHEKQPSNQMQSFVILC
jgi:hypothetical protein